MNIDINLQSKRRDLVRKLCDAGYIKTDKVAKAFLNVPRENFIKQELRELAYNDSPLVIDDTGQTISAPHMIAIMLEELELKIGLDILEIGTGSGYNAALIAEIINPQETPDIRGKVTSVERVPNLAKSARSNLVKSNYQDRVDVVLGDGTLGYPECKNNQMYDRIIVTAGSPNIPRYLEIQLREKGILLIPVGKSTVQKLVKIVKKNHNMNKDDICECMFVPLIGMEGHNEKSFSI